MKTNIALIGFMGTGKTAVGQVLAKQLGRDFIELDLSVEQKAGKSIPEIFQQDGEIAFRELEIEVTKEITGRKRSVFACGGGIVLNKINVDRLRESSVMVYLTASPEVILKRVSKEEGQRPLLSASDKAAKIEELLRFRQPFYKRAADIKLDTSKLDINSVAEQIIKKMKQDESFTF
ncbi:shikimate kinase [Chloroflexota bacterium]